MHMKTIRFVAKHVAAAVCVVRDAKRYAIVVPLKRKIRTCMGKKRNRSTCIVKCDKIACTQINIQTVDIVY